MMAAASPANLPRTLAHDIDGVRCRRCGIPYPETGTGAECLLEGESLRAWYDRQSPEIQKLAAPGPHNFTRYYRPHGDRVVVLPDAPPELSPSGLWYPPSFIEDLRYRRPVKGTVMAVGPGMLTYKGGRWPIASDAKGVKAGDRVLFQPQGGFEIIRIGPYVYMSLRDDFLLAEITEE